MFDENELSSTRLQAGGRKLVWQRLADVGYTLGVNVPLKMQEGKVLAKGRGRVEIGEEVGARDYVFMFKVGRCWEEFSAGSQSWHFGRESR